MTTLTLILIVAGPMLGVGLLAVIARLAYTSYLPTGSSAGSCRPAVGATC